MRGAGLVGEGGAEEGVKMGRRQWKRIEGVRWEEQMTEGTDKWSEGTVGMDGGFECECVCLSVCLSVFLSACLCICLGAWLCVRVSCARACVCAHVCACVHVCVHYCSECASHSVWARVRGA